MLECNLSVYLTLKDLSDFYVFLSHSIFEVDTELNSLVLPW